MYSQGVMWDKYNWDVYDVELKKKIYIKKKYRIIKNIKLQIV